MNEHLAAETAETSATDGFDWMMVEIFGHRKHWGKGIEVERFGSKMLRIDIPTVEWSTPADGEQAQPVITGWTTMFYGGASIFSNALSDEATVLKANTPYRSPYRASLPAPADHDGEGEYDDEDDRPF